MTIHNVGRCIDGVQRHAKNVQFLLAAVLVSVFSLLPIATASAAPAPQTASQKQTPSAPRDSDNGVTGPVASKSQAPSAKALAPAAWSVGLTASSTNLWPKQYSTLTATANQNVGPTAYYISIYDVTAGTYLKVCGTGTVCSISLTQPTATTHAFRAYISTYPSTNPPANQVAVSGTVSVQWKSISVSLKANVPTTYIGGTSTLTATTSTDVWPTPFYTQIYDATTGVRLKSCASGTTCAFTTSQGVATTHRYVAYVSDNSAAYLPTGIQATSNSSFITWANSGYRVSLSSASAGGLQRTLTATSNVNVGLTPYYIEIFNARTGTRLAICGSGTTCSTTVSTFVRGDYVAFISSNSTSIPPLNTQANSNIISLGFTIIFPVSDTGEVAGQ